MKLVESGRCDTELTKDECLNIFHAQRSKTWDGGSSGFCFISSRDGGLFGMDAYADSCSTSDKCVCKDTSASTGGDAGGSGGSDDSGGTSGGASAVVQVTNNAQCDQNKRIDKTACEALAIHEGVSFTEESYTQWYYPYGCVRANGQYYFNPDGGSSFTVCSTDKVCYCTS